MRSAAYEPRVEGGARLPRARPAHEVGGAGGTGSCPAWWGRARGCARRRRARRSSRGRRSRPSTRPCRGRSRRRRAPWSHLQVAVEALARDGRRAASAAPRAARAGSDMILAGSPTRRPRGLAEAPAPHSGEKIWIGHVRLARVEAERHVLVRAGGVAPARAQGRSTASSSVRSDRSRCALRLAGHSSSDRMRAMGPPRRARDRVAPAPPPSLSLPASAENIATNGQYGLRGSVRHDTPAPHEPAHQRGAHRMRLPRCRPGARPPVVGAT